MRQRHCIPGLASVHHEARQRMSHLLPWRDYRESLTVREIFDLLLLMTTTCRTLSHIVRCFFAISDETARQAILSQLPDQATLTGGLVDALHHAAEFSRRDRRRRWIVAIDENKNPFYGQRSAPGIQGGQHKQGTNYFYTYATAALIHRRRRYVVGLIAVTESMKPHRIVEALLNQIRERGLQVGGVVLDSGFESGETLLLLQERRHSYTVPLRRKGNGKGSRNALFERPSGTVESHAWVTWSPKKPVSTRVLVWHHRHTDQVKVYAFSGWSAREGVAVQRRAWLARRRYRERFGIETSYRQKNQGRAWTTSKNPTYRLLLEGLSYLVRQLWVTWTRKIAEDHGLSPKAWVAELPHDDLLERIADEIKAEFRNPDPKSPENPEKNS
jgi:hypothetical protein